MDKLSVDHLLGIKYLKKSDINLIFKTATHFKEVINRPIKKVPTLRDMTIANLFFENSTRTKISFELAQKRLGADVVNFSSSSSSVNKGESLTDTVNNILAMKVDMIVLRHPNPGSPLLLSSYTNSCIINAGDGAHEHPTQALLDCFSLTENLGDLKDKNIYFLPLGVSGEIGMNFNMYGFNDEWLIVDCGVTFKDHQVMGADVFMPNINIIEKNNFKISGLLITHAHEDHIGAVHHLWPYLKCPIFLTPFSAHLLKQRLIDSGLLEKAKVNIVEKQSKFNIGGFKLDIA